MMSRLKLVILITICLLIMLTAGLAYSGAVAAANNQRRLTDIGQVQSALNIYFTENGSYPYGNGIPNGITAYLDYWPVPPFTDNCPTNSDSYKYAQKYGGDDYTVNFCLGAKTDGIKAGSHILTSKGIQ